MALPSSTALFDILVPTMNLGRTLARHGPLLSGLFAFSLVTLHTVDNLVGVDQAWRTWLDANGMIMFFELRYSELKLSNFLAASAALPLILLFNLMTTERSFFGVLAALTHGSIIATWGKGGTARMSAAKHVLASFVVFLVCEVVKLIKAGAQVRAFESAKRQDDKVNS